jgi:tetratricopeptide (TPR) repeat protein
MGIGNYSEAAIELDKAVIRDPNFAEARRSLAIAQFNEKAFAEACSNYDVLIKQSSAEFDVLRDSISRNSTTSQDDAQKLEQLRSVIAYYHFVKGLNLEQIGEFEKAEQECRLGLEGVTTKEAATTMKRIQKAISDKHSTSNNPPAQAPAPVQQNTAPAAQPTPAAAPSTPTGHFDN